MSCLFTTFTKYNFNVSAWDVSNVKDMSFMFADCKNFNSDLSKWDVRNVKQSRVMFTRSAMKTAGIYNGENLYHLSITY